MANFEERFAITFGEIAILHVGGVQIGAPRANGFTVAELCAVAAEHPDSAELVMISDVLPQEDIRIANEAAVLVVRGGAKLLGVDPDSLLREQKEISYDHKFWDVRHGETRNKLARYNVVFGDHPQPHSNDYRVPTVQAFAGVPLLKEIRSRLPVVLGPKAEALNAEGNHYFEKLSGIGYHGDAERLIVICLSLGGDATLRYHWRSPGSSNNMLPPVDVRVKHGDIYVMSEKATGHDWRKRSKTRVVHAAGSTKYIRT